MVNGSMKSMSYIFPNLFLHFTLLHMCIDISSYFQSHTLLLPLLQLCRKQIFTLWPFSKAYKITIQILQKQWEYWFATKHNRSSQGILLVNPKCSLLFFHYTNPSKDRSSTIKMLHALLDLYKIPIAKEHKNTHTAIAKDLNKERCYPTGVVCKTSFTIRCISYSWSARIET